MAGRVTVRGVARKGTSSLASSSSFLVFLRPLQPQAPQHGRSCTSATRKDDRAHPLIRLRRPSPRNAQHVPPPPSPKGLRQLALPLYYRSITIDRSQDWVSLWDPQPRLFAGERAREIAFFVEETKTSTSSVALLTINLPHVLPIYAEQNFPQSKHMLGFVLVPFPWAEERVLFHRGVRRRAMRLHRAEAKKENGGVGVAEEHELKL